MGIFSKLFVAVMAHIIMENADKKIQLLIICFQLKIVDILLSFFLWASLYFFLVQGGNNQLASQLVLGLAGVSILQRK